MEETKEGGFSLMKSKYFINKTVVYDTKFALEPKAIIRIKGNLSISTVDSDFRGSSFERSFTT